MRNLRMLNFKCLKTLMLKNLQMGRAGASARNAKPLTPAQRRAEKVGPNDPCPCGSGKKYKKCCGAGGGED